MSDRCPIFHLGFVKLIDEDMKFSSYFLTAGVVMCLTTGCSKDEKKNAPKVEGASSAQQTQADHAAADQETPKKKPASLEEAASSAVAEPSAQGQQASSASTSSPRAKEVLPTEDKVAARFADGTFILQSEVLKRMESLPKKLRDRLSMTQLYDLVLFVVIQEELAYKAAIKEGLDERKPYVQELKTLYTDFLHQQYLDGVGEEMATEEAIQKQYKELTKDFKPQTELGLRHILVETKEDADRVFSELKAGRSFDDVQVQFTKDKKTLPDKGFLGYFRKSQLPKETADVIMSTEAGQVVSVPVFVSKTGYSILLVTDKRQSRPAPIEKVKDGIRSIVQKRAAMEHLYTLFHQSGIKMFAPDGSPLAYKTVDEKLKEARQRKANKDHQPTALEKKQEDSLNSLTDDFVVITLDSGKSVTFAELSAFIKEKRQLFKNMPFYEVYTTANEEYVNRVLLDRRVTATNLATRKDVVEKWNETRRSFLYRAYMQQEAAKLATDEEARKRYERLTQMKPEVETSLRVIPVKSVEEGRKAIAEIRQGKKFDDIFDRYCSDDDFKQKRGELGYLNQKRIALLSSELAAAVEKAPKATVLPEPLEVQGRVLVVRVVDKKVQTIPPFKDVKDLIKKSIVSEMKVKVTMNLIKNSGAHVFDSDGQEIDLTDEKALERRLGGNRLS